MQKTIQVAKVIIHESFGGFLFLMLCECLKKSFLESNQYGYPPAFANPPPYPYPPQPSFNPPYLVNDIALLELEEELDLNVYTPVCLARAGFTEAGMSSLNLSLR